MKVKTATGVIKEKEGRFIDLEERTEGRLVEVFLRERREEDAGKILITDET